MGPTANAKIFQLAGEIRTFTVSESQLQRVQDYIRNQEAHHSRVSFEDEFRALLKSNGIEFNEKYLWE